MSIGSHVPSPRCVKAEKFPFLFNEPKLHLGEKPFIPSSTSLVQVRPLSLQKGVFLCPFQSWGDNTALDMDQVIQFTPEVSAVHRKFMAEISIIVSDGLAKDVQPKVCLAPGSWGQQPSYNSSWQTEKQGQAMGAQLGI